MTQTALPRASRKAQVEVSTATPAERADSSAGLRLTPEERQHLEQALTALTPRERQVALALCEGGANEEIAVRLCIALPTLRTHMMRINQKLGTTSKGEVVGYFSGRLLEGYRSGAIGPSIETQVGESGGLTALTGSPLG